MLLENFQNACLDLGKRDCSPVVAGHLVHACRTTDPVITHDNHRGSATPAMHQPREQVLGTPPVAEPGGAVSAASALGRLEQIEGQDGKLTHFLLEPLRRQVRPCLAPPRYRVLNEALPVVD